MKTRRHWGKIASGLASGAVIVAIGLLAGSQLGSGTPQPTPTPTPQFVAVDIAAGIDHTCAVVSGGSAKCWGDNDSAQLGTGSTSSNSTTPVSVSGISGANNAGAGDDFTCMRTSSTVKCWGRNDGDQNQVGATCNNPCLTPTPVFSLSNAASVSTGLFHGCALTTSNRVKCWGGNGFSQLGLGSSGGSQAGAFEVCATGRLGVDCAVLTGAAAVAAGQLHTCVIMQSDGGVKCWGRNDNGQLGDNSTQNRSNPVNVCADSMCTALTGATAVAGGEKHSCAVISGGSVKCWGHNGNGQVGHSNGCVLNICPADTVSGVSSATSVAAGAKHSCALSSSGGVVCWGDNSLGQIGDNQTCGVATCGPTSVSGLSSGVTGIVAKGDYTCALLAGGSIRCWGDNGQGQLGDGSTITRYTPVNVAGF